MHRALLLVLLAWCAVAQQPTPTPPDGYAAPEMPEWNRPVEPFRIVGNVYCVGAANAASYLITTDAGHILIETGFRETVPLIEANVRKLGFRFEDIRLLLSSHAHYDHSGGLADVKARTGARLLSSTVEEGPFARGGKGDFAFGDRYAFPPVRPDGVFRDGEVIELGGVSLTALYTPGHTAGCTSFTTEVREGTRSYHVVFPCSLTARGYQLLDNPGYPDIVDDFEGTFAKLRVLPCDIYFVHHRSAQRMLETARSRSDSSAANPFVDREGYRRYIDDAEVALRRQIDEQRAAGETR